GSLLLGAVRGALGARRGGVARPGSVSFRGGLAALPEALARAVEGAPGGRVACGTRVAALDPLPGGGWRVSHEAADGGRRGAEEVDGVVLAVPAHAVAGVALPRPLRRALAPVAAVAHAP